MFCCPLVPGGFRSVRHRRTTLETENKWGTGRAVERVERGETPIEY